MVGSEATWRASNMPVSLAAHKIASMESADFYNAMFVLPKQPY